MSPLKMADLDLNNKQLLIRVDLNVPIENGKITSTTRIEAILPTIQMACQQNAKVILMSHLGRPKEGYYDADFSLAPVATYLSERLGQPVKLIDKLDTIALQPGQVVLLENIRFMQGEKENSALLGKKLGDLCDIFVMDAFATAHRKEASTYSVAEHAPVACAGPLLVSEMDALQQILKQPAKPLVAIVGGSKVSTKLSILKNILKDVDVLIVGGGIANTFLAAKGYNVGKSLYEPDLIPQAIEMLNFAEQNNKTIALPEDVVVAKDFSSEAKAVILDIDQITDEFILDIGPRTIKRLLPIIQNAKTLLWNGPVGLFEWEQFSGGTEALAKAIANSQAYTVAGGGDTLAAIEKYHVKDSISYISTGGGAFLEVLEGKKLPAIAILERRNEKNDITIH
ncbi:MAG: phosphoglycerate kinase [Gammaproteobacteria bacterium]|nr:phosphoglycerate kinase [Gammaproteobacteria bacterium]